MQVRPFIITRDDAAPISVLGVRVTVLAANTATRGYEVTLQEGDEGSGPPPHTHDWDESFYVLRGEVEIHCEGKLTTLKTGSFVHLPRGTVHGYRFGSGGGAMLEVSSQGGFATKMFTNVGEHFPGVDGDIPKLLELLAQNGVRIAA